MPIIAVCPYCQRGKIRAPESAIGRSATCPKCANCFTIVASNELVPLSDSKTPTTDRSSVPAAGPQVPAAGLTVDPPSRRRDGSDLDLAALGQAEIAESAAVLMREPVVSRAPTRLAILAPDPALPYALAAISLAGIGLALSQAPYGRFATVLLGLLALLAGGWSLLNAKRRVWLAGAAAGVGVMTLFVALILPSWLGLSGWLPTPIDDKFQKPVALPFDGSAPQTAEWIDVSKLAWQHEDVRVSLNGAAVSPVELKGPQDQKQTTRDRFLVLRLRVANVGVARRIDFHGWSGRPAADGGVPRLTDSAGKVLPAKTFDAGWAPAGAIATAGILPGKGIEDLLIFEPPAEGVEYVRLELPATAFGEPGTVKLQIPRSKWTGGVIVPMKPS